MDSDSDEHPAIICSLVLPNVSLIIVIVVVINLGNIPGKHKIKGEKKKTILGTANLLQKVLT